MTDTEQQLETQTSMLKSTVISSIGVITAAIATYSKYSIEPATKDLLELSYFLIAIVSQAYISFLLLLVLMMDLTKYRK